MHYELSRQLPVATFHWLAKSNWQPDGNSRIGGIAPRLNAIARIRLGLRMAGESSSNWLLLANLSPQSVRAVRALRYGRRLRILQTVQTAVRSPEEYRSRIASPHVIAVSDRIASDLSLAGFRPHLVRPVPFGSLPKKASVAAARSKLDMPPGARYIMHASKWEPKGGTADAIRAFSIVANKHPDLHLLIANRPSNTRRDRQRGQQLRRRALSNTAAETRQRIREIGVTSEFDAIHAGAVAHLLPILDTRYHKLDIPLVLLEAMRLGIPICVYAVEPIIELDPNAAGFGAPPNNLNALAEGLDWLATAEDPIRFRIAASNILSERFDVHQNASVLMHAMQEAFQG